MGQLPEDGLIHHKMFSDHHDFMVNVFPAKELELRSEIHNLNSSLNHIKWFLGITVPTGLFLFYILFNKVFPDLLP